LGDFFTNKKRVFDYIDMMRRELVIWIGFVDKGRDVVFAFVTVARTDLGFGHTFLEHGFSKGKYL